MFEYKYIIMISLVSKRKRKQLRTKDMKSLGQLRGERLEMSILTCLELDIGVGHKRE